MNNWRLAAVFFTTAGLVAACGGSSGGGSPTTPDAIDPATEPSAVMQSIAIKIGASSGVLKPGNPPAKTNDPDDPVISSGTQSLTVSPGGTQSLSLSVDSEAPLSSLFAKVIGADSFVEIDIASQAKAVSDLQTSVELPNNIASGEFCIEFSVANNALLASAPVSVCFTVDTSVLDSLQGTWDGGCDAASDGLQESFLSVWTIEGNVISNADQRFDGNLDCSGSADASDVETIEITVLGETTASDGQPATRVSLFNVSEDRTDECLVRVASDSFTIVCGGVDLSQGREFTRVDEPTIVDPASACFNPVLWQDGTEYTVSSRETEDGQLVGEFSSDFTVFTGDAYEGRPATRVFVQDSGSGLADANEYYQVDFDVPSITEIADEDLQGLNDGFESTPGELLRFDLAPGESYSYTSTYTETGSAQGDSSTATITYVGRETISVPAGTFETCRFNISASDGYSAIEWIGVNNGLEIAEQDTGPGEPVYREELLSAEINGVSVE